MAKIIKPPVEEARRLFEGKIRTKEVDVGISFINYGYCTLSDGSVHIMDPRLPYRSAGKGNGRH